MATVIKDECKGCGICAEACPKDAIELNAGTGTAKIDGSKCIGCGKCYASCHFGAIKMHGIKEQTEI